MINCALQCLDEQLGHQAPLITNNKLGFSETLGTTRPPRPLQQQIINWGFQRHGEPPSHTGACYLSRFHLTGLVWFDLWCFQQYFSYIVAVSLIGGGNRSVRRKSPTCRKSLSILCRILKYHWNSTHWFRSMTSYYNSNINQGS